MEAVENQIGNAGDADSQEREEVLTERTLREGVHGVDQAGTRE